MTEDFMAKYEREARERKLKGKEFVLSLIPALKAAGIDFMFTFYDGEGDSGQIESTKFFKVGDNFDEGIHSEYECAEGESAPTGIDPKSEGFQDAIWGMTPPGFEINEGGYGAVVLDVQAGTIHVNEATRIEDVSYDHRDI